MNLNCRAVFFLLSFCFCLTTFIISFFSISFSCVCICQVIFFIMRTLVAVIIAMIAQQKSVNDHLFSGAFLVFQTYIHIFHNQFRPPQNQFLSFYLACQSDITDHGSNVVSHLLLAVFACHRNCSVGDKPNKKFFKKNLYGFIRVITNLFFYADIFHVSNDRLLSLFTRSFLSFLAFYSPIN